MNEIKSPNNANSQLRMEAKPEIDRSRFRKSCNTCTRAKKKCDGGQPCMYCGKWSIPCIYAERQRPGPSSKIIRAQSENFIISYGDKIALPSITSNRFNMTDVSFLRYFVTNMNSSIPLLSPEILSIGVHAILNHQESDYSNSDICACMSLVWTCCGIGSSIAQNGRVLIYFNKARNSVQRCFDSATIIAARAFFALEILRQLSDEIQSVTKPSVSPLSSFLSNDSRSKESNHSNSKASSTKPGLYQTYGEAVVAQLKPCEVDESLRYLMNMLNVWNYAFLSESIDLSKRVASITDEILSNLPAHLKVPAYALNVFLGWQLYFKSHDTGSSSIPGEHLVAFQQDLALIRIVESTGIELQDSISYFTLLTSVGMHSLKLSEFDMALSTMRYACQFLLSRPSILSTPVVWRMAFTVASVLHFITISRDPVIEFECSELCRLLIMTSKSLCRPYRLAGDEIIFDMPHNNTTEIEPDEGRKKRGFDVSREDVSTASEKKSRGEVIQDSSDNSISLNNPLSSIAQILATLASSTSNENILDHNKSKSTAELSDISSFKSSDSEDDINIERNTNNASLYSIDTGITSLDNHSDKMSIHESNEQGNSMAAGQKKMSFTALTTTPKEFGGLLPSRLTSAARAYKLSELDMNTMAIILDLHLFGLVSSSAGFGSCSINSNTRIEVLSSMSTILIDTATMSNVAMIEMKKSELSLENTVRLFSSVDNIVNFVFTPIVNVGNAISRGFGSTYIPGYFGSSNLLVHIFPQSTNGSMNMSTNTVAAAAATKLSYPFPSLHHSHPHSTHNRASPPPPPTPHPSSLNMLSYTRMFNSYVNPVYAIDKMDPSA